MPGNFGRMTSDEAPQSLKDFCLMREGNEDNKPHLCVPTLDGNAHVIPTEVFDKIISGEMKITDMEDWEIITRTAFSEWLRGLETTAKERTTILIVI